MVVVAAAFSGRATGVPGVGGTGYGRAGLALGDWEWAKAELGD